jgi:nitrogen fixation protein FixH
LTADRKKPPELTGRHVLIWLIGFFGLIFLVNAVLVQAAISTFGGVETTSSYKAGLQFGSEVTKAMRQQDLHWRVEGNLRRGAKDDVVLDIDVRDASGNPVNGLSANATFAHPANSRLDRTIALSADGLGHFHGAGQGHSGQWELIVDFHRGVERVFRSRSRVKLK